VHALAELAKQVEACRLCSLLATSRTQTVFGVGNPMTRLCFFGEAPGADEDRQGEPFVGKAGQLLDRIISACTLRRDEVYILNTLKCRPPGNRNPEPDEISNCRPFFEQQLDIIRPEFICCLGLVAASSLLGTKSSLSRLRGRLHPWRWARVLVTYHPAYLLRNPGAKQDVWNDMQFLMQEMGVELPVRGSTRPGERP
jgi:DNA polymerase